MVTLLHHRLLLITDRLYGWCVILSRQSSTALIICLSCLVLSPDGGCQGESGCRHMDQAHHCSPWRDITQIRLNPAGWLGCHRAQRDCHLPRPCRTTAECCFCLICLSVHCRSTASAGVSNSASCNPAAAADVANTAMPCHTALNPSSCLQHAAAAAAAALDCCQLLLHVTTCPSLPGQWQYTPCCAAVRYSRALAGSCLQKTECPRSTRDLRWS